MKSLSLVLALFLSVACQQITFAQERLPQQLPPAKDHEGIYRMHPNIDNVQLLLVPPAEVQPGLVYNYYHSGLKQRVWGLALEGGEFQYAFGETTTIPTNKFDLRVSPEMQERILEQRAPRLLTDLDSVSRSAAVRLNGKGIWELLPFPSSSRVFDMLTNQRWEWHGQRRLAVLHIGGNLWHVVDGEFYPVTILASTCH
jgi:hypothetical protein